MSRLFLFFFTLQLIPVLALAESDESIRSPNIILIYADDVGYGDLSGYGADAIDTPNLDRMAREGVRFRSAYATAATCTPSRYSVLTGEYAFRNERAQILPGNAPLIIDPQQPTLASILQEEGYATGLVGKWHLGLGSADEPLDWNGRIAPGPKELGFTYSFHMAATGDRVPTVYIENGFIVGLDPEDPVNVNYQEPVGEDPTGLTHPELLDVQADDQHAKTIVDGVSRIGYMSGGHSARWIDIEMPDTFLEKAKRFISNHKKEPFFLLYAVHENHVPRVPHPRFRGSTRLGVRGDAVAQMDWGIGEILEHLGELELTEETLVIFSSDNGPVLFDGYWDGAMEKNGDHRPAGPWRGGKYSAWEGGTRMPMITWWPGTIEPSISDALFSQVDLFVSLASLAGASYSPGAARDSVDLASVLTGESDEGRDHLVQQGVAMKAIRAGDWKYIPAGRLHNRGNIDDWNIETIPEPGLLFYLPEDPREENNLASRYPGKVRELKDLLSFELSGVNGSPKERDALGGALD